MPRGPNQGLCIVAVVARQRCEACEASAGDPEAFRDSDQAFHRCLIGVLDNSVAIAIHGSLIEWGLFNPELGPKVRQIHTRVIGQHKAILEAIRAGDPLAAANALRTHLATRRDATDSE